MCVSNPVGNNRYIVLSFMEYSERGGRKREGLGVHTYKIIINRRMQ